MPAQPLAWWQVIAGVLTIPATLLGLVYTFRLYQKTKLEIQELELKIVERQRALGLTDEASVRTHRLRQRAEKQSDRWQTLKLTLLPNLVAFAVLTLIPRPHVVPLTSAAEYGASLATALLAVGLWQSMRKQRAKRDYAGLSFGAMMAIVIAAFALITFLVAMAVWVIRVPNQRGETVSVVVGDELTDRGRQLLKQPPYLTHEQALKAVGMRPEKLWRERSLRGRVVLIVFSFNVGLLALFGAVAAVIEMRRLRTSLHRAKERRVEPQAAAT